MRVGKCPCLISYTILDTLGRKTGIMVRLIFRVMLGVSLPSHKPGLSLQNWLHVVEAGAEGRNPASLSPCLLEAR